MYKNGHDISKILIFFTVYFCPQIFIFWILQVSLPKWFPFFAPEAEISISDTLSAHRKISLQMKFEDMRKWRKMHNFPETKNISTLLNLNHVFSTNNVVPCVFEIDEE